MPNIQEDVDLEQSKDSDNTRKGYSSSLAYISLIKHIIERTEVDLSSSQFSYCMVAHPTEMSA